MSWLPNLEQHLYNKHLILHHEEVSRPLPAAVAAYVCSVANSPTVADFKRKMRQLPDSEDDVVDYVEEVLRASRHIYNSVQNLEDGEAMFNDMLLFPFLKAVSEASATGAPQFKVGETRLKAMAKRSNELVTENDDAAVYMADGIISLYELDKLEVLLLETSGHYNNKDASKISFDHHKGLFSTLSMIKAIAEKYSFGSVEAFKKVKVFFLHTAGKTVRLWSMRCVPEGPAYELWLEQSLDIDTSFGQRAQQVPFTIKFYWTLKCLLKETAENIAILKQQHMETITKNLLTSSLPTSNLSSEVNCSMLKLTEEEDKSIMCSQDGSEKPVCNSYVRSWSLSKC